MTDYDDYRIANDDQAAAMNAEFSAAEEKGRNQALKGLPVYLTDEATKAAALCAKAAKGCEYLLDYATNDDERKLLGYAASAMSGLSAFLGRDDGYDGDGFGSTGVKRSLAKTFLLCNGAAVRLCGLADSSGGAENIDSAARTALCAAQCVMAVYLMQI